MKIANSMIDMESQHTLTISYSRKETILLGSTSSGNSAAKATTPETLAGQLQDQLDISQKAINALQQEQAQSAQSVNNDPASQYGVSDEDKLKIELLQSLLKLLTGKNYHFQTIQPQTNSGTNLDQLKAIISQARQSLQSVKAQSQQGSGLEVQVAESYQESEQLNFKADGVVHTADGQEINFNVQLNMSREYAQQSSTTVQAGKAVDPLEINFDGTAAQLTTTKYSFDLNSDGTAEQISFLKPGSGFLALDANNDHKIDDGSELFGPKSGNGFSDLAKYDSDHNGWIDENDPIFDKLQIWTKDANGNDQLFSLGQKGIGAIFLGNVSAQFALKDPANVSQGESQQAGVFLKENGTAGTVQQIDLVV
jgi:hypothetical protein